MCVGCFVGGFDQWELFFGQVSQYEGQYIDFFVVVQCGGQFELCLSGFFVGSQCVLELWCFVKDGEWKVWVVFDGEVIVVKGLQVCFECDKGFGVVFVLFVMCLGVGCGEG